MKTIPLKAQQQSIHLALDARRAFARGREAAATDPEIADEHYLEAFDLAQQTGQVCGLHDLPAPFVLTQVQELMVAFDEGEAEGRAEREAEFDEAFELDEARERFAA